MNSHFIFYLKTIRMSWFVLILVGVLGILGCQGLEGFECRTGRDCQGLDTCSGGWCLPAAQNICQSDKDCSSGSCNKGICQTVEVCTPSELSKSWTIPSGIQDMDFRPDQKKAAMITKGGLVLWDLASLKEERVISTGSYGLVRWSPDGLSVGASISNRVLLWSTSDWNEPKTFSGTSSVYDFQISKDNVSIFIAFQKDVNEVNVKQWDIATGKWLEEWTLTHPSLAGVRIGPDRKTVALFGENLLALYQLSATSPRVQKVYSQSHQGLSLVKFNPEGTLLAVALKNEVRMLRLSDGSTLHKMKHDNPVVDIAFPPKGDLMATASGQGPVRYWDTSSGQFGKTFLAPEKGEFVLRVMFLAAGTQLAYGTKQGIVRIMQCPKAP